MRITVRGEGTPVTQSRLVSFLILVTTLCPRLTNTQSGWADSGDYQPGRYMRRSSVLSPYQRDLLKVTPHHIIPNVIYGETIRAYGGFRTPH